MEAARDPVDAREALLHNLIDDAGLFPPARKPLDRAVADHRKERQGPNAWMLGRFLCPVSRLQAFAQVAPDARGWTLGAIFDGSGGDWSTTIRDDLRRITAYRGPGEVRGLEARLPGGAVSADTVRDFLRAVEDARLPHRVDVFLEVTPGEDREMVATLEAIADVRSALAKDAATNPPGAKLRCGGITKDLYPSARRIATFIATARRLGIPFKATAGLHHPFRHYDEAVGVLQHGFVNLLAATALDVDDLATVVAEDRADAFAVGPNGLRWRGTSADADAVRTARGLFRAYGSCSFDEPVADLAAHGILPLSAPAAVGHG